MSNQLIEGFMRTLQAAVREFSRNGAEERKRRIACAQVRAVSARCCFGATRVVSARCGVSVFSLRFAGNPRGQGKHVDIVSGKSDGACFENWHHSEHPFVYGTAFTDWLVYV